MITGPSIQLLDVEINQEERRAMRINIHLQAFLVRSVTFVTQRQPRLKEFRTLFALARSPRLLCEWSSPMVWRKGFDQAFMRLSLADVPPTMIATSTVGLPIRSLSPPMQRNYLYNIQRHFLYRV